MSSAPAEQPAEAPEEEVITLTKAQLDTLADEAAKAAYATLAEKMTDPATRPSFGDPTAIDEPDSPVLTKGYLPHSVPQDEEGKSYSVNVNLFPSGDIENFSVARWAYADQRARMFGDESLRRKLAPWENQYISAGKSVPFRDPVAKANMGDMVSGQDGGFLAPEAWTQSLQDILYPSMITSNLPLTRIPVTTRVVHIPVVTNPVTVYYAAENAALTASSPQFSQRTFTMRKQSALVYVSNELIADSIPAADDYVRKQAAMEFALDQDKQILLGSGQNGAPTGLLNTTNVGSTTLGTNGTALALSHLEDGIYNVQNLNGSTNVRVGEANCTGIVGAVRVKRSVVGFQDGNNRPLWDYGISGFRIPGSSSPFQGLLGVDNWVFSNIVPTNITTGSSTDTSYLFYGDWKHLWVAERSDTEFMVSNVAGNTFANDQTAIRLIRRYDVAVMHPEAFYVQQGVRQ